MMARTTTVSTTCPAGATAVIAERTSSSKSRLCAGGICSAEVAERMWPTTKSMSIVSS